MKKSSLIHCLFIYSSVVLISGCSTISNVEENNFEFRWEVGFQQPYRDNRFPENEEFNFKEGVGTTIKLHEEHLQFGRTMNFSNGSITRCDEPITICRHGIYEPSLKYYVDGSQLDEGLLIIKGEYVFSVAKSQSFDIEQDGHIIRHVSSVAGSSPTLPEEIYRYSFNETLKVNEPFEIQSAYGSSLTFMFSNLINK